MKQPAVALFTLVLFGCSSTDNASSQGVADGRNASSGGASSGGGAAVAEAGSSAGAGAGGGTAAGAAGSVAVPGSAGTGGSTASSAGSGGAGASTGGASTAGASGGSPNPCAARPGLLFCDDFEAATAGVAPGAPWSSNVIGSTSADIVAVDDTTAYAHSGRKSVHVHGASYQNFLSYHDAAVLPQTNSKFFLRAFVRFDAAMTVGRNTFVLADTFAAPNTGFTWRVGEMSSMLMTAVNTGTAGHLYFSDQAHVNSDLAQGVKFAVGAYTCLELMADTLHQELQVWVNGTDVPDLHVTGITLETYDYLHFGFEKDQGPSSDFWFDDIAIGTQQIGCE